MGMDGSAFAAYIRNGLVPELEIGTAAIRDNLATHKNAQAAAALGAHGCRVLYRPPYSPNLDPIENPMERAFSKLKVHLWTNWRAHSRPSSGQLEKSATSPRR